MERQLPSITIQGTSFMVDVMKEALIETGNPGNVIPFKEMDYKGDCYLFDYDPYAKNLPGIGSSGFIDVRVLPMAVLDPEGMALKYGKRPDEIIGKTDLEIMIDQDLYQRRLSGHLPVIEIMGHPFYVDVRMDSLRPKDDFSTPGIRYSEIDNYAHPDDQRYWIPYHPSSHSIREIDAETITEIPKDIFLVEIPTLEKLDPVGYARYHGFDIAQTVMANPIERNMVAKMVDWKETALHDCIKENLLKQTKNKIGNTPKKTIRRNRGHRM